MCVAVSRAGGRASERTKPSSDRANTVGERRIHAAGFQRVRGGRKINITNNVFQDFV